MLKRLRNGKLQFWLLVFVLVGVLFSAQAYFLYDVGRLKAYNDAYENAYRESAQHNEYNETERKCRASFSASKAVDCIKEAEKAERERHHSEQDLNAQRQMADWAWWMMIATAGTFFVTIFGVTLIAKTLQFTKIASEHTESMLSEAQETTSEARRQADIAERAFNADIRPFVGYTSAPKSDNDVENEEIETDTKFFVGIKNFGRIPAKNVYYGFSERFFQADKSYPPTYPRIDAGHRAPLINTLHPGEHFKIGFRNDWGADGVDRIKNGEVYLRHMTLSYDLPDGTKGDDDLLWLFKADDEGSIGVKMLTESDIISAEEMQYQREIERQERAAKTKDK